MGTESKPENMNVVISLSDKEEQRLAAELMKKAGAQNIDFAENLLEMILIVMKYDSAVIITEDTKNVLDIGDALKYVADNSRFSTVSVLSDGWAEASEESLLGSVDVFLSRPLKERSLVPAILVDAARKKHMRDLEREYRESEESFARDKNMSFAEHIIMDTLGLPKGSAGEYIRTLAEKNGYDEGEVSKIVYDVLLAGGKK